MYWALSGMQKHIWLAFVEAPIIDESCRKSQIFANFSFKYYKLFSGNFVKRQNWTIINPNLHNFKGNRNLK